MVASLLILVFSLVLLIYWFRYTCLFMLRSRAAESACRENGLSFGRMDPNTPLTELENALERDYRMLVYLLEHASGLSVQSVEERILMLDYRAMRLWYWVTRTAAPVQARKSLEEMSQILRYLATEMDQRAEASQGRA